MGKKQEVVFEFAKYNTGEVLHITLAHTGAKGFYCIGCNSAMIPYFGKRQPHFKHHPNDIDKSQECTWSDETYRHKIAKEILQRLKEIKVPKVSIAVPKEYGGGSVTIAPPQIVRASSVAIERYIYEDEYGQVRIEKSFDDMGGRRHLLVKPDILFLDEQSQPILIIELCATHRTDEEKRLKLMHLGINAIEVLIPKAANAQEIEKNLISSHNTKWLYSNEQATTKFNPTTHLTGKSSANLDREPGDIPRGETVQCRTFRIRECIRGIKKFMASSDFTEGKRAIEENLSRVKRNTERVREELAERNNRARAEAEKTVLRLLEREQQKVKELEPAETRLAKEAEAEERDYRGLEKRYYDKRDRLISEQQRIREEEGVIYRHYEGRRAELVGRITELRECNATIERVRKDKERVQSDKRGAVAYQSSLSEEERRIEKQEKQIEQQEKQFEHLIKQEQELRQRERETIEREADEVKRMEADISEMERKQSRVRKSREQLARIKDRAIDARFNQRG
ncbi:hypothetical protein ACFS7Z_22250 [Pontibacter toksunensis]|uniref:Competence protein CoiA-like protein n=1 Tax=Pontibacter toksunensis TaxID=1332631 RepID=A0ABW6C1L7_9BACT